MMPPNPEASANAPCTSTTVGWVDSVILRFSVCLLPASAGVDDDATMLAAETTRAHPAVPSSTAQSLVQLPSPWWNRAGHRRPPLAQRPVELGAGGDAQ